MERKNSAGGGCIHSRFLLTATTWLIFIMVHSYSTITTWTRSRECEGFRNMLEKVPVLKESEYFFLKFYFAESIYLFL